MDDLDSLAEQVGLDEDSAEGFFVNQIELGLDLLDCRVTNKDVMILSLELPEDVDPSSPDPSNYLRTLEEMAKALRHVPKEDLAWAKQRYMKAIDAAFRYDVEHAAFQADVERLLNRARAKANVTRPPVVNHAKALTERWLSRALEVIRVCRRPLLAAVVQEWYDTAETRYTQPKAEGCAGPAVIAAFMLLFGLLVLLVY